MYPWGITADGVPSRLPEYDVLTIEVPVRTLRNPVEQFTIFFNEKQGFIHLNFAWDKTLVKVPIKDPENMERVKGVWLDLRSELNCKTDKIVLRLASE